MPAHSILPSLDKDVERFLVEQARVCNMDIGNSKEVSIRLCQREFDNGTLTWEIDGKVVLRLKRENITETLVQYTLEKVPVQRDAPKQILVSSGPGIIRRLPGRTRRSRVL